MISVIMPCYLGDYPGAASNRPVKLRRAIESFLDQGIGELIVICDACQESFDIANEYPISVYKLEEKAPMFSGIPRQVGINLAKYDYIAYLDCDDMMGEGHLQAIVDNMQSPWLYWDDFVDEERRPVWLELQHIGTSAIAHRKNLPCEWVEGYGHDWVFVQQLMNFPSKKIEANYRVMHIPGRIDK